RPDPGRGATRHDPAVSDLLGDLRFRRARPLGRDDGEIAMSGAMQPRFRTLDGLEIRCAEREGAGERTVLLTSPWPASILPFPTTCASLGEDARLFAIDLPGFGRSERREDLLSPRAMGEFLGRVIEEAGLGAPHVVAPDVGTAAALFLAAEHPDKVSSVIVGT